jgi:integrase
MFRYVSVAKPGVAPEDRAMKLTAKRVARLLRKKPGRHHDGHGLHLQITSPTNASWLLRYQRHGKEHWLGLGPVHTVGLADARMRAKAARLQLLDGIDPLQAKRDAKAAAKLTDARRLTFVEAAEQYHKQHLGGWRSVQHAQQWLASLATHAFPVIGYMDVATISTPDVLRVVEPIWQTLTVTADRVRNRIESIIDWTVVRGHRPPGTNPARWKGHLDEVLLAVKTVSKPQHFAALAYVELPLFMQALRSRQGVATRAMEFAILTAARSGEVLGAKWEEIDLGKRVWVVPAERMKAGKEHHVPLAPQAIELLRALPHEEGNEFVFIGAKAGAGLSVTALFRLLQRTGHDDVTVHGFRSAFSDWAHETTAHSNHSIEISLAHAVGNEVEKAYRRGDMFNKRKKLMAAWADYCCSPPAKQKRSADVVPIRGGR